MVKLGSQPVKYGGKGLPGIRKHFIFKLGVARSFRPSYGGTPTVDVKNHLVSMEGLTFPNRNRKRDFSIFDGFSWFLFPKYLFQEIKPYSKTLQSNKQVQNSPG